MGVFGVEVGSWGKGVRRDCSIDIILRRCGWGIKKRGGYNDFKVKSYYSSVELWGDKDGLGKEFIGILKGLGGFARRGGNGWVHSLGVKDIWKYRKGWRMEV